MKLKMVTIICWVILLLLASCNVRGEVAQSPTPTLINTPLDDDSGTNILVASDGEVKLKRAEWSDYFPTTFGATLHRGDLLFPSEGSQAVVLCDDLRIWIVPLGISTGISNGCPHSAEPALERNESKIGSTRPVKTDLSLIPYIIGPRRSRVLSTTPTIRWNQVPGATSYTVTVRGVDLNWSEKVEETEVVYSGQPPLKPGEWYSVIVQADNGKSSQEEDVVGLGFSPLDQDDIARIQSDADQLGKLNLSNQAYAYALAQLYISNDLITDAIQILEDIASQDNTAATIYRTLGDLYYEVELLYFAEERYMEAIRGSEQIHDLEGVTISQERLGEVFVRLGRVDKATQFLTDAIKGYNRLGDTSRAKNLTEILSEVSQ